MAELGLYDDALKALKEYYGAMLDLGATSFFEDFDVEWAKGAGRIDELLEPGKIDFHLTYGQFCYKQLRHSLCHGWAAGVIPYIVEYVIGFKQIGKDKYEIRPHMSGLKHIHYVYPLGKEQIVIDIKRYNASFWHNNNKSIKKEPSIIHNYIFDYCIFFFFLYCFLLYRNLLKL